MGAAVWMGFSWGKWVIEPLPGVLRNAQIVDAVADHGALRIRGICVPRGAIVTRRVVTVYTIEVHLRQAARPARRLVREPKDWELDR